MSDNKNLQDAQRQVRREKRDLQKEIDTTQTGKYVNPRSHTPPNAQIRDRIERLFSNKFEKMTPEFGGGKKRTNKMLKKRRRTNKRK
jgi:hypothetical protein